MNLWLLPEPKETHSSASLDICGTWVTASTRTSVSVVLISTLSRPCLTQSAAWSMSRVSASSWLHGEMCCKSAPGSVHRTCDSNVEYIVTPRTCRRSIHLAKKLKSSRLLSKSLRKLPQGLEESLRQRWHGLEDQRRAFDEWHFLGCPWSIGPKLRLDVSHLRNTLFSGSWEISFLSIPGKSCYSLEQGASTPVY